MNNACESLIEVFQKAKILLALPDNDYSWSSWDNANDAILMPGLEKPDDNKSE